MKVKLKEGKMDRNNGLLRPQMKALNKGETIEIDENLIKARTKLAWSYYESGELDKALDIYNNTLKKAEELNNMDGISACLNDIATIYETNGNYKKALSFYKRSLKIREEFDNKKEIASTLSNIGTLYYVQGDYNNAQHYGLYPIFKDIHYFIILL